MGTYARYSGLSGGGSSSGVTSLNTLTGAVLLAAGTNITLTPVGNTITIDAAGGAAITSINSDTTAAQTITVGTSGTNFAITNPGSGSHVLNLPDASASARGALTSADWSTFNGKQSALTIGNLTDAGTDGIVITSGTGAVIGSGTSIAQHVADSTHNGYLSSTDWSTFNGKQSSGNYITALTGDVAASGPGSSAATLATVNSNVGTFGDASNSATVTVNAKGLVTAASSNSITAPAGALTGTTLASNVVTSSLTTVGTIATGTWSGTTIALNKGGTGQTTKAAAFDALSPQTTLGDIIYGGTSGTGTRLAGSTSASLAVLTQTGNGTVSAAPAWSTTAVLTNPMTTGGDVIYGGASGTPTRLANGSATQVLASSGTTAAPTWVNAARITAWTSYTPTLTGLGTTSGLSAFWRQVGSSYQVRLTVVAGTPTAALASVTLPGGASIDTAAIPIGGNTTAAAGSVIGNYGSNGTNSNASFGYVVTAGGTNAALVYVGNPDPHLVTTSMVPANGNTCFAASSTIFINFEVPISGAGGTTV